MELTGVGNAVVERLVDRQLEEHVDERRGIDHDHDR